MKSATQESYIKRIDRVLTYLAGHLDTPLDLHRLAEEASLSPYHFHRIYVAIMGETVMESVRRFRLQRAAISLLTTQLPLQRISEQAGYGSVQAFSRAFRHAHGVAPAAYRKRGGIAVNLDHSFARLMKESNKHDVVIESVEPQTVAALRHTGSYPHIDLSFERVVNWAIGKGYMGPRSRIFGIFHDDPTVTPAAQLRADACVSSSQVMQADAPFHLTRTPGGRCAVVMHTGPCAEVEGLYNWMFGSWLPANGEIPDDQPCFLEHLDNPRVTPPAQLRTRLYVPLKE